MRSNEEYLMKCGSNVVMIWQCNVNNVMKKVMVMKKCLYCVKKKKEMRMVW